MLAQLLHIWIVSCIMYVMTSGFRIYLRLRGTADFSYIGIIIFGGYAMAILLSRGWDMGTAFIMSLVGAMGFCLIVLRIITRLSSIYFNIGTFAIYILVSYCATNLEITKGAFGISLPSLISHPETIGILYSGIVLCVIGIVHYFHTSVLYTTLAGWGAFRTAIRSLGIREKFPLIVLITLTTTIALIGSTMYLGYYTYISPGTFWMSFLITLMATTYGSFIFKEYMSFVITFGIWYGYEMFRFIKIVEPSKIGYLREMLFALLVMGVVFFVFRRLSFSREQ